MFSIRFQTKSDDKFITVKTINVESFNDTLANSAVNKAVEKSLYVQLLISNDDPIPTGYSYRRMEFNTVIWKNNIVSTTDAMSLLNNI